MYHKNWRCGSIFMILKWNTEAFSSSCDNYYFAFCMRTEYQCSVLCFKNVACIVVKVDARIKQHVYCLYFRTYSHSHIYKFDSWKTFYWWLLWNFIARLFGVLKDKNSTLITTGNNWSTWPLICSCRDRNLRARL